MGGGDTGWVGAQMGQRTVFYEHLGMLVMTKIDKQVWWKIALTIMSKSLKGKHINRKCCESCCLCEPICANTQAKCSLYRREFLPFSSLYLSYLSLHILNSFGGGWFFVVAIFFVSSMAIFLQASYSYCVIRTSTHLHNINVKIGFVFKASSSNPRILNMELVLVTVKSFD